MRKVLLTLVLMSAGLASGQTAKQWKTIQVKTVTGAAFQSGTIFTPAAAGLYRISATYVQNPSPAETVDSVASFFWTDQLTIGAGASIKVSTANDNWGSAVFIFNPVIGKPVIYQVSVIEGNVTSYRLEFTLEKFE